MNSREDAIRMPTTSHGCVRCWSVCSPRRFHDPESRCVLQYWQTGVFFEDRVCSGESLFAGSLEWPWSVLAVRGAIHARERCLLHLQPEVTLLCLVTVLQKFLPRWSPLPLGAEGWRKAPSGRRKRWSVEAS